MDDAYTGLSGNIDGGFNSAIIRPMFAKRRTGRRRGDSVDHRHHRLLLGLGGTMILAAAAVTGYLKPPWATHIVVTPPKIGTYARMVALERQANTAQLRSEVIKESLGTASRVVTAVYESGTSTAGNQIIMFIGGNLSYADPVASILSFTQKFAGRPRGQRGFAGRQGRVRAGGNLGERRGPVRLVRQRQLRRDRFTYDERRSPSQDDTNGTAGWWSFWLRSKSI